MTTTDEAPASLDGLFRDLLDVITDEVMPPPLRHTSDTDLYPVIAALAEALASEPCDDPDLPVPVTPPAPARPRVTSRPVRGRRNRYRDVRRPARLAVRRNRDTGETLVLAEAPASVRVRCLGGMGVRCRRTRGISPSGYCPRCHELSRDAADAYELIAPDWDDVGWEWRNEAAAELAGTGGEVRVLWQCQELTDREATGAAA